MTPRQAEAAFRWLMRLYPAHFRRAHGLAMFELFRDDVRAAHAAAGRTGVVWALARAAADTAASALPLRLQGRGAARPERAAAAARPFAGAGGDLRLAARRLRQTPAFAATAILMLGAGIGANIVVFSVADAVLLRPLAAGGDGRIVRITGRSLAGGPIRFSVPELAAYQDRATTLDALAGVNLAAVVMSVDGESTPLLGEIASGSYLPMLGARAVQGRLPAVPDDRADAAPVVAISESLWRRAFSAGPVVGRHLTISGRDTVVAGVVGASFPGSFVGAPVDLWMPLGVSGDLLGPSALADRTRRPLALIGRLRPGVDRGRARAELQTIAGQLARDFGLDAAPAIDVGPGTLATGEQRRFAAGFLALLQALVVLVLIVACANVGNLLLARTLGRRREIAIRLALGAAPARLARMLAVEGSLLAAAGGAAAILLARWTMGLLSSVRILPTLALRLDAGFDGAVIGAAVLAIVASAALLAAAGMAQAFGPAIVPALKEDSPMATGGRSRSWTRNGLAIVQVAVSLVLLVSAALLERGARRAAAIDPGFDPRGVVALDVDGSGGRTPARGAALFTETIRRLEGVAGVEAAAVSTRAPLDSSTPTARASADPIAADGRAALPSASYLVVGPRYFDVVRTPLLAGRVFTAADDLRAPRVAIVNEALARRLWPAGGALGRRLWLDAQASAEPCLVVGIARNGKYVSIGEQEQGHVYLPFAQHPRAGMTLLVRSTNRPDRMLQAAQRTLHAIDPEAQGFFGRTLEEHVAVSLLPVRVASSLAVGLSLAAAALAAVGLYALIAFLVAERAAEIGVRMALGASRPQVVRLVLGSGLRLVLAGVAVGLPAAIAAGRVVHALIPGLAAIDGLAFAGAAGMVLATGTLACFLPARRAARLDPLLALRRG